MPEPDSSTWSQIVERLLQARRGLLLLTAVITLGFVWPASLLRLDESIESFFSDGDPLLQSYLRSQRIFGGDEFVMVGYEVPDPTSNEELDRQSEFSKRLSATPGIRAQSTQDLTSTLRNPRASGLVRVALRLPTTERTLLDLARRVLIGDDGRTTAIVMRLEPEQQDPALRRETFARIQQLARQFDPPAMVAGEPVQVHQMFRDVEQDSWVLGLASSGLLMLAILILFRNLRWVLLPILVIHATLIWTRGLLYLSGMQLSMVSSMLTSLVTIIGIATVMHVTVTYREMRHNLPRREAFRATALRLAAPIFWTCFTTAIGFASLLSSRVTPVRSFGVMMALGTILVPVLCLMVLPGGVLIGRFQADPLPPPTEGSLVKLLTRLSRWSLRSARVVIVTMLLLVTLAAWGLTRIRVETDFSKNFRKSSPIVQALEFFETRLGGVGSWEVGFSAPETLDDEFLEKVRTLAEDLRGLQLPDGTQLTKVIALTDGLDLVPKIPVTEQGQGRGLLRMIPRFRAPTLEERKELLDNLQPEMSPSLYGPDAGRMRIMLRALEQQPAEVKLELIKQVEQVAPPALSGGPSDGVVCAAGQFDIESA